MKTLLFAIIVQLTVSAMLPDKVTAQSTEQPAFTATQMDLFWIDAGIGIKTSGRGPKLGLNAILQNQIFAARWTYGGNSTGLGERPPLHESVWDAALLFGKAFRSAGSAVTFSGGISYVSGVDRGRLLETSLLFGERYDRVEYSTFGMGVQAQAFAAESSLGIGVYVFGDLNPNNSFAGMGITLVLGKLR